MLDRAQIAALIPHAGAMCLLGRVLEWDGARIRCSAVSHTDPANPMRSGGLLPALCGIEYAAQAMAVHGGLSGVAGGVAGGAAGGVASGVAHGMTGGGKPRAGFLVALRDVTCRRERLDDLADALDIAAVRVMGDAARVIYQFTVRAGGMDILSGRATVVLDADAGPA